MNDLYEELTSKTKQLETSVRMLRQIEYDSRYEVSNWSRL